MARIIENLAGERRMIKLSAYDILSIVQDYQRIVPHSATSETAYSYLCDAVIFIPEDV